MRSRTIIAAGLAVFLTLVSSWASACDLSCSLDRIGAGCDDSATVSATTSAVNSPEMSEHCKHAMQMGNGGAQSAAVDGRATEWISQALDGTQPCSRNSVSASAAAETDRNELRNGARSTRSHQPDASIVSVAAANIAEPAITMHAGKREAPPPLPAAVNPLSISLRI